ncbi:hypothetical protein [Piscinibacter koreensis]|uniref:Uncharacterized protein n=1 Tax=Piscinibacter koreensis TaxID=2742824 RepID=A0A7Y6NQS7_9BURK|nr:hypothetical protein [Schlegelella koreensis]NUZ07621.1 hypothetical protein [Schlegelella koreensis]
MKKDRTLIQGTAEAWENGPLGGDDAHAKRVSAELEQEIEDAMGLQAISIRLPRSTIQTYKALAKMHGVGYQPLMRDAICRWAEGELKQMLIGAVETQRQTEAEENPNPPEMKRAA